MDRLQQNQRSDSDNTDASLLLSFIMFKQELLWSK